MTMLRVVGGTDVGDEAAAPVWEDPAGSGRVLRSAIDRDLECVVLVGRQPDGALYVASSLIKHEEAIGYLHRAVSLIGRCADGA